MSASTRKYMSKRQRPCDFCRSRKTACRIESYLPCRLCALHGRQCTFVEATQPRKRTTPSESNVAVSSKPIGPDTNQIDGLHHNVFAASPEDQDITFLPSPANLLFGNFADQFFSEFRETEPDVQFGQEYPISQGEPSPGTYLARTDTQEATNWLETEPVETQLDGINSLHPQALGHSGDMDPYLLQNYRYDPSGAFKFKQLSVHSVSQSCVPTQFLISQPGLFSPSREEMGLRHTSPDISREMLESLVSVDTGLRLISLFRTFVLSQYPIFSDSLFPDPRSSPPYLLAAIYMVAQPFAKLDDVLSIELAYEDLNNEALFKLVNEALQWEAHNPSLSVVQTMLLLVIRPSTNPLVLESSFKWSLHGTLVTTAQTLGLHYDPSSWSIVPWQTALRRRVSCTIFTLDKWLAASLGRPPLITRDAWLVTSLTDADGYASSIRSDVWSQHVCYTELGSLLGHVLFRLFSIRAINELAQNIPKTLELSKELLDELTSWHHEFSRQPRESTEEAASLYTVCELGYHYVQMTVFRAIIRPFIARLNSTTGTADPTNQLPGAQQNIMGFARTGVRSSTTSATNFVKSLKQEHSHIFWPHWSQVAFSSICFLDLIMAVSSSDAQEAASCFADLHIARKEMRLKSNMFPVLRLGLLRIDAVFWKGVDKVLQLQPHVAEALLASLHSSKG